MIKTTLFSIILLLVVLSLACAAPQATPPLTPAPATAAPAKAEWERKWDAALAGAKQEGSLSIWTTGGAGLRRDLTPILKQKFGISLDILSGNQGELLQKLTAERQAGIKSVDMTLFSPVSYLDYLKPRGMVTPLANLLILPDIKNDKDWLNGKFPMFDSEGTVIALTSAYFSYIVVNTDLVKPGEVKSYKDLLDPKWKGKITMFDPTAGPSPAETFVNFVVPRFMGQDEGKKFLQQLVKQDITYSRDRRLNVEWVAKGKFPIGIAAAGSIVDEFAAAGAPIAFIRPEEGGLLAVAASCITIIDGPPHPNAATVFLNWVLTEEGQKIFSAAFPAPPRRLNVPYSGTDQFSVVRPGDKTVESDEAFYVNGKKTAGWAREIFGPVVAK